MSLYNALFGINPAAPILLTLIGVLPGDIPRYRDCYLEDDYIVVYTRTGGGNRDYYEEPKEENKDYDGPFNADLRKNPFFVEDADDSFDSTYAHFKFKIPHQFKEAVNELRTTDETDPRKKWERMFKALSKGDKSDPLVQKANEVMQPIAEKIQASLEKNEDSVVKV